jgi:hypothetical protein
MMANGELLLLQPRLASDTQSAEQHHPDNSPEMRNPLLKHLYASTQFKAPSHNVSGR